MNVDVYSDSLLPARDAENEIRALRPDSRHRPQDTRIARKLAIEFLDGLPRDRVDLPRLGFVKRAAVDKVIDLRRSQGGHGGRSGSRAEVRESRSRRRVRAG